MTDKQTLNTITIGIPAYNEGLNIKKLLNDLLSQELNGLVLEAIIINCDNCTDNTASECLSLNNPLIKVWDNKDRKGPAGRQNEITSSCNSDILLLLNADILPANNLFLYELIAPISSGKVDLVASKIVPSKANTFFEKVIHSSVRIKKVVFESYKNGHNLYTCHGTSRAFTKRLYKKLDFNRVIAEDAYSYLFTVNNGMKYFFADKSIAYYKLPNNLKDHIRQSSRFLNGRAELLKHFDADFLAREYFYPKKLMLKSFIDEFISRPILVISYVVIFGYVKLRGILKPHKKFSGIWESVVSTKSPVKNI